MKKIVKKVNNKVIISGNTIEFYDYEIGYYVGYTKQKIKSIDDNKYLTEEHKAKIKEQIKVNKDLIEKITAQQTFKMTTEEMEQNKLKNNIKSNNRAKTKVRRLIDSNLNKHKEKDKFITLTIKENEQNREKANYDFKKFIKRLKYHYKKFDYIAVIEKQKRGAIHYHVIFFGLPYIKKKELQEIWNKGFVKINAIENYDRLGQYLVKYMTKDIATGRAEEQKRYLASRGLKKPVEIQNIDIDEMIEDEQLKVVFKKKFKSEYVGEVEYIYCENI